MTGKTELASNKKCCYILSMYEHNFINMNDISVIFGIKIGIKINDLIIKKCDKSYIKTMSKLVSRIYALKY